MAFGHTHAADIDRAGCGQAVLVPHHELGGAAAQVNHQGHLVGITY